MTRFYKTGEFAKLAGLMIRTIRYYDKIGLLKPTMMMENGYRLYSDKDFMKLQKIVCLKSLGFSLDDIFSMTVNDSYISLQESFLLQKKLIDSKIKQLENMKEAIESCEEYLDGDIDWSLLLNQIQFTSLERELVDQYKNASNVDIRIKLHEKYSMNPMHWFNWLYQNYDFHEGMKILEIGCGNGRLWLKNKALVDLSYSVTLSDTSLGMLEDTKKNLKDLNFTYNCFDFSHIPYDNETFDCIICNHALFYAKDIDVVLNEVKRVLKKDGVFYCSTYGESHMKEMN